MTDRTDAGMGMTDAPGARRSLVGWILLCFCAAAGAPLAKPGAWYAALAKPAWNPPSWLFGPVWTLLYLLMAVAAWMVWRSGGFRLRARPLGLFLAQLAANAVWTPLFFGLHSLAWALVDILLLWMLLALTVRQFARVSRLAAGLLAPYLGWVTFAAILNFTIWQLNR